MKLFKNLLLSVGAMKAGTSWLYHMLEDHPDINITPVKEVHYFWDIHGDSRFLTYSQRVEAVSNHVGRLLPIVGSDRVGPTLDWMKRFLAEPVDDAWFAGLFTERSSKLYCAEFSNMSSHLSDEGWAHVRSIAGSVRVLYTVRSPVSRMWSHARYHAYLTGELEQFPIWDTARFQEFLIGSGCVENGRYSKVIDNLRRNFTEAEVLISDFSDIRDRPVHLLRDIEDFLNVSHVRYSEAALKLIHNAGSELQPSKAFKMAAIPFVEEELTSLAKMNFQVPDAWTVELSALSHDEELHVLLSE